MPVALLAAVLADYRWHDLPSFDPPRPAWPFALRLSNRIGNVPRPLGRARARSGDRPHPWHGLTRATVRVRFRF